METTVISFSSWSPSVLIENHLNYRQHLVGIEFLCGSVLCSALWINVCLFVLYVFFSFCIFKSFLAIQTIFFSHVEKKSFWIKFQKYKSVRTVPKSNLKIVEAGAKSMPITLIYKTDQFTTIRVYTWWDSRFLCCVVFMSFVCLSCCVLWAQCC